MAGDNGRLPKKPWMHWRQWAAILLHRNEEALDQLSDVEDPIYDSIRREPRFRVTLKRIGYPESTWR